MTVVMWALLVLLGLEVVRPTYAQVDSRQAVKGTPCSMVCTAGISSEPPTWRRLGAGHGGP